MTVAGPGGSTTLDYFWDRNLGANTAESLSQAYAYDVAGVIGAEVNISG